MKTKTVWGEFRTRDGRCTHRVLTVKTERDRCSWVVCNVCGKEGPKKHSYMLALICFATATVDQHPRARRRGK